MTRHLVTAACAGLLVHAAPAAGQAGLEATLEARAKAIPDGRHAWQETWLLPEDGAVTADAAGAAFAGRATVVQDGGRERLEVRAADNGGLADPVVVVYDRDGWWLVTRVGATPLAASAKAGDRLLGLVLAGPPGPVPPHRTVPAGAGVAAVVLRHPVRTEIDPSEAFALELPRGGGGLLRTGLSSFSPAGDAEVVAAAGARGVDRVQTANGTVSVTPDPGAVAWMEAQGAEPVALEEFKLEERLAPYDALPRVPADETEGEAR